MDEIWLRVSLVAGALAIAALIAAWRRRRRPTRRVGPVSLEPGTYFFSSASCSTCARARATLDRELGERSYVELTWEEDPNVFAEVGVDAVPAVLIMGASGQGRVYPGQPGRVLDEL